MRKFGKFLAGLLFYVPFSAAAVHPALVALIAGSVAVVGFSIYRSFVPADISQALSFFSSCWSCRMFSDILRSLSELIPKIYEAVGVNIVPIAAGLTFVWFTWMLIADYIKVKSETNAWEFTGKFSVHLIKLAFVAALLAFPLPRFMMGTFIGPVMNLGFSYNRIVKDHILPGSEFDACMVATAVNEPTDAAAEAFGPGLRHNMTCQIAEFHQLTGLGMTVGWTFANMAFSRDYMYGPVVAGERIPVFPNVGLIIAGWTIMVMFLWALLPVPLYFLKTFMKLSMDLIMLPLMLLGWLFSGWKGIFPSDAKTIKGVVEDAVKDTAGIALVGLFTGFAVLFLDEMIGNMNGMDALIAAVEANDSRHLMDALMLNNSSMINIILAGLFIAMFMNAIPKMVEELFKTVKSPDTESMQNTIASIGKSVRDIIKTKAKIIAGKPGGGGGTPAASPPASP